MVKKVLYTFNNENSKGLDKVPLNSVIFIENNSGSPKLLVLTDDASITDSTTITTFLGLVDQWEEFDTGASFTYESKSGAYTASVFDYIYADTSSGVFTITLPATPSVNDEVYILDTASSFGTNNLTVDRNSETIMGLTEDIDLNVDDLEYKFIYTGSDWRVL